MNTARRFVLVDDFMPIRTRAPLVLQPHVPLAAKPAAHRICEQIAVATPRFTFNGVRALLRPLLD